MARRKTEPEQRKVALAFAGPGDSTLDNTTDLLDDYLHVVDGEFPDDDVLDLRIIIPAAKTYLSAGFKTVVEWLDNHELAYEAVESVNEAPTKATGEISKYAEEVHQSKDINRSLIDFLVAAQEEGFEARLIVLWGEDGDENSEALLSLAESHDIMALDLTAGLDDIGFGDEETEEEAAPEPEPEPEPEKKPTRSRSRRSQAQDEEEPPFEPDPPKRSRTTKKAEEIGPTPKDEPTLQEQIAESKSQADAKQGTYSDFSAERRDPEAILRQFLEAITAHPQSAELTLAKRKVQEAVFWLREALPTVAANPAPEAQNEAQEAPTEEKRGRGRPRTRSASQRAVTEIWDEDLEKWVRAGRGRLPADAKTRKVDPDTGDVVE